MVSRTMAMGKTMKDLLRLAVEQRQEEDEWAFVLTEASRDIAWSLGLGVRLYVTPVTGKAKPYFETSYVRLEAGEESPTRMLTGNYYKAEDALEGAVKAFTDRAHGRNVREVEERYERALDELVSDRLASNIRLHYRGQIAIEGIREPK